MQELNNERLVFNQYSKVGDVWTELLNNDLFTKIMQNFKNAFTMNYNNADCIFFLSDNDGIIFNVDTKSVNKLDHYGLNNTGTVVAISHWEHNMLVQYQAGGVSISNLAASNPITLENTKNKRLCYTNDGKIQSSDGPCDSTNHNFIEVVQFGFITEQNVYLVGYSSVLNAKSVMIFSVNVLSQSNPETLTNHPDNLFFLNSSSPTVIPTGSTNGSTNTFSVIPFTTLSSTKDQMLFIM